MSKALLHLRYITFSLLADKSMQIAIKGNQAAQTQFTLTKSMWLHPVIFSLMFSEQCINRTCCMVYPVAEMSLSVL